MKRADFALGLPAVDPSRRKQARTYRWLPAGGADQPITRWMNELTASEAVRSLILTQNTINRYTGTTGEDQFAPRQVERSFFGPKARIDVYQAQLCAYFLERLKATPDGDGNLLDQSLILYGGGMGDGNLHRHADLPTLMAGSLGGKITPGRHLNYKLDTPMSNLLLTILDAVDVPIEKLGDSPGRLPLDPLSIA